MRGPNWMYQGGEKVNLPRSDSRDVIALHSPIALLETGLRTCPPEKRRDSDPLRLRAVHSLQSGLRMKYCGIRACFAHFAGTGGGLCLQFRLCGGEGGIRTLGTGVSPYNGLANESLSPRSLVVKHLQSDSRPASRARSFSIGNYCASLWAPICSP